MVLSKNNITNEWIIPPTLSYVFLVACRSAKGVNTLRLYSCMGATRSDACASPQVPSNLMYTCAYSNVIPISFGVTPE